MKTNATKELKAALEKVETIEALLIKERKLRDDSSAEMHSLIMSIDLFDPAQVGRMTTLLTISQVGADRAGYRHKELEAAKIALIAANVQFSKTVLYPRCQQLEQAALAKVEGKLRQHFPEDEALRLAARQSTELSALAPIL